jgi:O-antigen biosynthesis protein WbqP
MSIKNVKFSLNLFLKRALDIIVSLLGLIIISPIILIVSLIIRLDSPGPAILKQKRVGKDNKIFIMYKFRTMKIDTPQVAKEILLKQGINTYMTRVGPFLRKTLIDEVPQLINVLKGDMSLVGPRPALYNQYDLIEMRTKVGVHTLRPGMTGWAIIAGGEDLSLDEKVKADEYYLKNMSFMFDLKIILMTFGLFRKPKGIY